MSSYYSMQNDLKVWIFACRPKTLTAVIVPVLMGTVIASSYVHLNMWIAICTFISAIFIQIGTNLANDYFDYKKGADSQERLGPKRYTGSELTTDKIKLGVIVSFAIAVVFGFILLFQGGWPIFWIGVLSLIFGVMYTGGPFPLGYNGLGELFVFVFFGPVAVGGTFYLQTYNYNPFVFFIGFSPGLLSAAILVINNLRDIKTDKNVNKKTLAVKFGADFAIKEYIYLILFASIIPIILGILCLSHWPITASGIINFILFIPLIKRVKNGERGRGLNSILALTSFRLLIFGIIFCLFWLL